MATKDRKTKDIPSNMRSYCMRPAIINSSKIPYAKINSSKIRSPESPTLHPAFEEDVYISHRKTSTRFLFWATSLVLVTLRLNIAHAQTWLGFNMGDHRDGVRVLKVLDSSPASKAGLKKGDIVLNVEGKRVGKPSDVIREYQKKSLGQIVKLTYQRGKKTRKASLKLTKRPPLEKMLQLLLIGERAKAFRAQKVDGGTVSLASLKGKVVLIEFWATWCTSCVASLKKLKKIYKKLHPKGFRVLALARNSVKDTKKKTAGMGLPFIVAADPGAKIANTYHLAKVPSLVLIDRKGIIRDIRLGSSYKTSEVKKIVERWLKEKQ